MRKIGAIFIVLVIVSIASCSDDDNPGISSGPLFSITVLDSDSNPAGPLQVGWVNHPIGGYGKSDLNVAGGGNPNPELEFRLIEMGDWQVSIRDYGGNIVKIYSGYSPAGDLTITWDGTDEDGLPVPGGFYRYDLIAGEQTDSQWVVLDLGPEYDQTIIGTLGNNGQYSTSNIALFPGLIDPQPIDYFTDTVTIHISDPDFPDDFYAYTAKLGNVGNSFSFNLDSIGLPEALVRVRVVDTAGVPVEGLNVGSINHYYIDPITPKAGQAELEREIGFEIPVSSQVIIVIYNYYGEMVDTIANDIYSAGSHTVIWDYNDSEGHPVVSGFYRYHLAAGEFETEKWMVFEKGTFPEQTIMGKTSADGVFVSADSLMFPALLGNPPEVPLINEFGYPIGIFRYRDSVTMTLSDDEFPGQFLYFPEELNPVLNSYELIWEPGDLK